MKNTFLSKAQLTLSLLLIAGLFADAQTTRLIGDDCTDPVILSTLPDTLVGSDIENYGNDYVSTFIIPWNFFGGDVVYQYECLSDEIIDIKVTGDFDQAFVVFTDCNDPTGSQIGMGANFNQTQPFEETFTLNATVGIYYFLIAAHDSLATGDWNLIFEVSSPCDDNLILTGDSEMEPNGGVNTNPVQYDPRILGTVASPTEIYGELSVENGVKDMDWYNFSLSYFTSINGHAEIVCGDIVVYIGNEDMSVFETINNFGTEQSESFESSLLSPGNYWIAVSPPNNDEQPVFSYNLKFWGNGNVHIEEAYEEIIRFYPNPAGHEVWFEGISNGRIEIYSECGKLIMLESGIDPGNALDLSDLAKGIYIIKMFTSSEVKVDKLIIR